jgi:hypothetical protein
MSLEEFLICNVRDRKTVNLLEVSPPFFDVSEQFFVRGIGRKNLLIKRRVSNAGALELIILARFRIAEIQVRSWELLAPLFPELKRSSKIILWQV